MTRTTSDAATASRTDPAARAPSATSGWSLDAERFHTAVSYPALTRAAATALPMRPVPMTETFVSTVLLLSKWFERRYKNRDDGCVAGQQWTCRPDLWTRI